MCGIAVAVGDLPDEARRRAALQSIRHRGPDGTGVHLEEGIFIGHTRLAILDLTEAASQPMVSPDGRFVLAYNGEIYNYVELRERIGRGSWPWRGDGDTEVLLALLTLHGEDAIPELRGMFAFVLWDRERRSVLAARDQFGIKPLLYRHSRDQTLLTSEIRAMCALGGGGEIDPAGVESFLLTGSVQGPGTILRGVRALPPGHVLEILDGEARERSYWSLPKPAERSGAEAELVEELDGLLEESVRLQLRSDVPVGVFLSGGIDSSLMTAYAAGHLGEDLRTFSVGFETASPSWDETSHARLVSERFGTRHERVVVSRSDFAARMSELARAIDQPSVDGVNSHFVCGSAAPHVKVALSGQGGDELFAGYNVFQFASRLSGLVDRVPSLPPVAGRLGRKALGLPARVQHNWYLRGAIGVLTGADPRVVNAMTNPLFGPTEVGARPPALPDPTSNGDLVNEISRLLIGGYLANTLLRDMDAMSMAHSLEVRVPLVDPVLAEFALSIPGSRKVSWGNPKALLRGVARRRLPAELIDRPKQGFNFPLAEWLVHPDCYARLSEALAPESVSAAGLVDPALVGREVARVRHPRPGDIAWLRAQRVWALFVLHEWHGLWRSLQREPLEAAA